MKDNLMTLNNFMQLKLFSNNRAYIKYVGFSSFYVRHGPKYINGNKEILFTIANMTAVTPGTGNLKRFLQNFWIKYNLSIYIEAVQTEKLALGLKKIGFANIIYTDYYMESQYPLNKMENIK